MAKLYRVYDAKAELFGRLVEERTDASARRAFEAAIRSPESGYGDFPGDYSLFRVGSMSEETGLIEPEKAPVMIVTGLECVKAQTPPLAPVRDAHDELGVKEVWK